MSETVVQTLNRGRDLAWLALQPVYEWAIHEALEAEYAAARAEVQAMTRVPPVYPPIVHLLVESVPSIRETP